MGQFIQEIFGAEIGEVERGHGLLRFGFGEGGSSLRLSFENNRGTRYLVVAGSSGGVAVGGIYKYGSSSSFSQSITIFTCAPRRRCRPRSVVAIYDPSLPFTPSKHVPITPSPVTPR